MTISTPAKVKSHHGDQPVDVLASNIDTLVLSIDVSWPTSDFLDHLELSKAIAKDEGKPVALPMPWGQTNEEAIFNIRPHGSSSGHAYLIYSNDFTLAIGSWLRPISRPSIMAQLHSEILWREGPKKAVATLIELIRKQGASIVKVRVSRLDLCVDVLLPYFLWTPELLDFKVTRAKYSALHKSGINLTGISIGKGKISARLYDKPLEIRQQSKKYWMFEIWGMEAPPEGFMIIRAEFQLRREALKELGIDTVTDLFEGLRGVWSYCTNKWLRFRTRPGMHHTMRKTFQWWQSIQEGLKHLPEGKPLVRKEAFRKKDSQYRAQAYGQVTALRALEMEARGFDLYTPTTAEDLVRTFRRGLVMSGKTEEDITLDVYRKRSKFHKAANPDWQAEEIRKKGF